VKVSKSPEPGQKRNVGRREIKRGQPASGQKNDRGAREVGRGKSNSPEPKEKNRALTRNTGRGR